MARSITGLNRSSATFFLQTMEHSMEVTETFKKACLFAHDPPLRTSSPEPAADGNSS